MMSSPVAQSESRPETQRSARLTAFGGPDRIDVADATERPEPGSGEVRIRVEASSVQFTDTLIRRGRYPDLPVRPPLTLGYDLVGRVDRVGPGVDAVSVGDRVADLTMYGGNARYAVRPAAGLVAVPESVDAAEAAALVLSWLTAQQALFRSGELRSGERVLITGGNGAVGQAAIVLAREAGAEVFATASERHHERLRELGATPLPREDWLPAVRGTMDVVLDGIAADRWRSPHRALRRGGRLVAIGMSAQADGPLGGILLTILSLLWRMLVPDGRKVAFYSITAHRKRRPDAFRADLAHLFGQLEAGRITPRVARRIGMSEVAEAHRDLDRGGLDGKIVLDPWR